MGIWREAMVICGTEICIDLDLLANIKKHDASFTFTLTDDHDHPEDTDEVYRKDGKCGIRYRDIHSLVNSWLEKHFPNIAILSADPSYDSDHANSRYFLAFDLDISEPDTKTDIGTVLTLLSDLDMDSYNTVYNILMPNCTYSKPTIFAVPHIW